MEGKYKLITNTNKLQLFKKKHIYINQGLPAPN